MTDIGSITLEAELSDEDAAREIAQAVSARHSIARKYVKWLRRRHPDAAPAEVIRMLERHYGTAIATAGAAITAAAIAADVGIGLIPAGGSAKAVGQNAAKIAGKQAAKAAAKHAAKEVGLGAAKAGAKQAVKFLPAGDKQLQFEITAIFGLAIADIHGLRYDKEQAHALVYGLSNGRVSQQQIAEMAEDLAIVSSGGVVDAGQKIAAGRNDWSHWASTLADALPAGAAQSLIRTIQTGQLDTVRMNLNGRQQAAIEYGAGAVVGGVTRFLFGQDVIKAARIAFPDAPDEFPSHLAVSVKAKPSAGHELESNRALTALKDAAKATGNWVVDTANAVGGGVETSAVAVGASVATAAETVVRPFRSVDIDGDAIPDQPQALSAVKGAAGAVAGAAATVGNSVERLLKPKKRG